MSLKCLLDNHSDFLVYQSIIRKYLSCRKLPSLMPGSGHAHSNLPLSDTLSARSYLEFGREEFQTQVELQRMPAQDMPISTPKPPAWMNSIEAPRRSGPRLQPRERPPIHKESEKTERAPSYKDPPSENDRPVRKRGRPRIETEKDAAAIEVGTNRGVITYRKREELGAMEPEAEHTKIYCADPRHSIRNGACKSGGPNAPTARRKRRPSRPSRHAWSNLKRLSRMSQIF